MTVQRIKGLWRLRQSQLFFVSNDGKERIILAPAGPVPDMSNEISYPHAVRLLMKNSKEVQECTKFGEACHVLDTAHTKLRFKVADEKDRKNESN